jgi:hypothetical protein
MSQFDDISKLPDINGNSSKTRQLEDAIRGGQFSKSSKEIKKERSKSFSSSSSDDEIDDGESRRDYNPKILIKQATDLADKFQAKKRQSVAVKSKHYMALEKDELKEHGVIGLRQKTARLMMSKPVDISLIVLIIFYTIMVLIFLAFDDSFYDDNPALELTFQITELVILLIF